MLSLLYMRKYLIIFMLLVFTSCATYSNKEVSFIKLDGNPTTGYMWYYSMEKGGIVNLREEVALSESRLVGAPAEYRYIIEAIGEGSERIFFEYRRPWEEEAIERRTYLVTVSDGHITADEGE